jgi:hypothetical protein
MMIPYFWRDKVVDTQWNGFQGFTPGRNSWDIEELLTGLPHPVSAAPPQAAVCRRRDRVIAVRVAGTSGNDHHPSSKRDFSCSN